MRKTKTRAIKSIDGVSNNIPNHFSEIYKELYVENIKMRLKKR